MLHAGGQNQQRPKSGQIGYVIPAIGGSKPLQSGGQNQHWATNGQIGYITLAVWGVSNALEQGTKSVVAQKWRCTAHMSFAGRGSLLPAQCTAPGRRPCARHPVAVAAPTAAQPLLAPPARVPRDE